MQVDPNIYFIDKISNKELILELIKINKNFVYKIYYTLKQDIELAHEIIKIDGKLFTIFIDKKYDENNLLTNREIVLAAVKNGNTDKIVFQHFTNDKEIMLEILKNDGCQIKYVSYKLHEDNDIVLTALKQNKESLAYISKETLYRLVINGLNITK